MYPLMLYLLLQSHYTLKQTLTQLQSTGIWFLRERGFREMWFLRESGSCISWVKIRLCPWFPARIWWNMPVALLGERSPMLVYQHSSHSVGLGRIPALFRVPRRWVFLAPRSRCPAAPSGGSRPSAEPAPPLWI